VAVTAQRHVVRNWVAANTLMLGVDLKNVDQWKSWQELHFWYFEKKIAENPIYLG
jgi:hypothetical protein